MLQAFRHKKAPSIPQGGSWKYFPFSNNFVLKKSSCQENVQNVQWVQWVQKVGSIFRFWILEPLVFFEV